MAGPLNICSALAAVLLCYSHEQDHCMGLLCNIKCMFAVVVQVVPHPGQTCLCRGGNIAHGLDWLGICDMADGCQGESLLHSGNRLQKNSLFRLTKGDVLRSGIVWRW